MWHPSRRLYACEFPNGVVKVGITGSQGLQRFNTLRHDGHQPLRFYCGPLRDDGFASERELLAMVSSLGGVSVRGREWFTGIAFKTACAAIDQLTAEADHAEKLAA